jgi:cytochrome c-type biogenesis protein CcmF
MVMEALDPQPQTRNYQPEAGDLAVGATLKVYTKNNDQYSLKPIYLIRDSSYEYNIPDTVAPLSLYVRFSKIMPKEKKVELEVKESTVFKDYIVMKAFIFPFINILWIGVLVMIVGFVMSIFQRLKQNKEKITLPKNMVKEKVM